MGRDSRRGRGGAELPPRAGWPVGGSRRTHGLRDAETAAAGVREALQDKTEDRRGETGRVKWREKQRDVERHRKTCRDAERPGCSRNAKETRSGGAWDGSGETSWKKYGSNNDQYFVSKEVSGLAEYSRKWEQHARSPKGRKHDSLREFRAVRR